MQVDEVPQENIPIFHGGRKAVYATARDGHYTVATTTGSQIEQTVTSQAIDEFLRQRDEARARVEAGVSSALEYHMYDQRMDLLTLAQSTGLWRWRVRRHLKPAVFARLGPKLLQRYADALGLTIDTLRHLP